MMNIHILRLSSVFVAILVLQACKDAGQTDTAFSRLFRPASFSTEINGNTVAFSWTPIANARYELEISRDSFQYTHALQTFTVEKPEFTVDNLWSQSRYSARVKAVSRSGGIGDSGFKEITFLTGTENIFYQPAPEHIQSNRIVVRWDKSKAVTHIVVSPSGQAVFTVDLSAADVLAGEKAIEGLQPGTAHALGIFNGEMKRGELTVSTTSNQAI